MSYTYSALRSTTPPLYYRAPGGVMSSYQSCCPEHYIATPQLEASTRDGAQMSAGSRRVTAATPPLPAVTYPFVAPVAEAMAATRPASHVTVPEARTIGPALPPPMPSSVIAPTHVAVARRDATCTAVASVESESNRLAAEELRLRAALSNLRLVRRRHEEEQLLLSHSWAALLEVEERYHTQPLPDLRSEIATHRIWCAQLKERWSDMHAQTATTRAAVKVLQPLVAQHHNMLTKLDLLRQSLIALEQRRHVLRARAEHYFDLEMQRADQARRLVFVVEKSLRHSSTHAPLVELVASNDARLHEGTSAFPSRMVSFAGDLTVNEKQTMPDTARLPSASPAGISDASSTCKTGASTMEATNETQDGNNAEVNAQADSATSYRCAHVSVASRIASSSHDMHHNVTENSLYLGVEDDSPNGGEDNANQCLGQGSVSGQSVVFSLNNADGVLSKRRRTELFSL